MEWHVDWWWVIYGALMFVMGNRLGRWQGYRDHRIAKHAKGN